MPLPSRRVAAWLVAAAALTWAPPAGVLAQPGGGDPAVVARVGSSVITAADLERRIAQVPPFQLRTLGKTPEEIRRVFLDRVLVREALLAEGGATDGLLQRAEVDERVRARLRGAMLTALRQEQAAQGQISDEAVKEYYQANRHKYLTPPRIAIWRILLATREEALAVLEEAKKDLNPKRWTEIAREKSIDKATHMRGGNIGFVAEDGTTGEAGVRVDPILFKAALRVKDAELVPEPVAEAGRWAVVWRRQGMKAVERTLESEVGNIRQTLLQGATEKRIKDLLEKLRNEHVAELHPELVDQLEITSAGDIQPMRRPGTLPTSRRPSAAPPQPVPGPAGLR
jgi:peptidyl-prolyl cis-trans isomerase C